VILEALKERETIHQLSQRFEIHPQQITNWKKDYLDKSLEIKDVKSKKESVESIAREKEKLYEKIVKLQMEVDFLKKISNYE